MYSSFQYRNIHEKMKKKCYVFWFLNFLQTWNQIKCEIYVSYIQEEKEEAIKKFWLEVEMKTHFLWHISLGEETSFYKPKLILLIFEFEWESRVLGLFIEFFDHSLIYIASKCQFFLFREQCSLNFKSTLKNSNFLTVWSHKK